MSDIESMKAELEANGYSVWGSVNPYRKPSHIETPDGFLFYGNPLNSEESQYAEVIEIAYAHYQREKKFAAMEALLDRLTRLRIKELVDNAYGSDNLLAIMELPEICEEAKKILGKGE